MSLDPCSNSEKNLGAFPNFQDKKIEAQEVKQFPWRWTSNNDQSKAEIQTQGCLLQSWSSALLQQSNNQSPFCAAIF